MTPSDVMMVGQEALKVTALLAAPMLLTALAVGLFVGIIQAATQIQEMTLSFIPKLIGAGLALAVAGHWMMGLLVDFTEQLIQGIPGMIG